MRSARPQRAGRVFDVDDVAPERLRRRRRGGRGLVGVDDLGLRRRPGAQRQRDRPLGDGAIAARRGIEEAEMHGGQLVHVGDTRNHHLFEDATVGAILALHRLRVVGAEAVIDRHGRRAHVGQVSGTGDLHAQRDGVAHVEGRRFGGEGEVEGAHRAGEIGRLALLRQRQDGQVGRVGADLDLLRIARKELVEERIHPAAAGEDVQRHAGVEVDGAGTDRRHRRVQGHGLIALAVEHAVALVGLGELVQRHAVGGDDRVLQIADADVADVERQGQVDALADVRFALRRRHDEAQPLRARLRTRRSVPRAARRADVDRDRLGLESLALDLERKRAELEVARARRDDAVAVAHARRHVAVDERHLRRWAEIGRIEAVEVVEPGWRDVLHAVDRDGERERLVDRHIGAVDGRLDRDVGRERAPREEQRQQHQRKQSPWRAPRRRRRACDEQPHRPPAPTARRPPRNTTRHAASHQSSAGSPTPATPTACSTSAGFSSSRRAVSSTARAAFWS